MTKVGPVPLLAIDNDLNNSKIFKITGQFPELSLHCIAFMTRLSKIRELKS